MVDTYVWHMEPYTVLKEYDNMGKSVDLGQSKASALLVAQMQSIKTKAESHICPSPSQGCVQITFYWPHYGCADLDDTEGCILGSSM